MLWHSDGGGVVVWEMNGPQVAVDQFVGQVPANWHFAATGDFNGDGKSDILLQSDAGGLVMLEMNGTQILANQFIGQIPSNWHVAANGDFNGDGKTDVLLHSDTGGLVILEMNGTQIMANQSIGQVPSNWHVAGTADVNGDGKSDVILTSDAGDSLVLEMNGTQIMQSQLIGPNSPPSSPPLGAQASTTVAASAGAIIDPGSGQFGDRGSTGSAVGFFDQQGGASDTDPQALMQANWYAHDPHFLV